MEKWSDGETNSSTIISELTMKPIGWNYIDLELQIIMFQITTGRFPQSTSFKGWSPANNLFIS